MSDFKVGCSPLTSTIYAGKVLKNGTWGNVKHDVTDTAVSAVAQHLLQLDERMQFQYCGKTYELKVVEVTENINGRFYSDDEIKTLKEECYQDGLEDSEIGFN